MDGNGRRPVTSGVGAFALVLLAVVGWWVFSGNGPQGPRGNDERYAVPEVDATADAGEPTPAEQPARPGAIRIDSYVPRDELRLAVNFRVDRDCAGSLETPRVIESDVSVTITLSAEVSAANPCSAPDRRRTLEVLLDSPLDDRAVLDGSRSPRTRVEPTSSSYE